MAGAALALALNAFSLRAQTPRLLMLGGFGGPGEDRLEGAAFAPDGSLWVAGTLAEALPPVWLGAPVTTWGEPLTNSPYGHAVLLHLDGDGRRVRGGWQLARGLATFNAVAASADRIYVGGYARPECAALLAPLRGLRPQAAAAPPALTNAVPRDHYTDPLFDPRHDGQGLPLALGFAAAPLQLRHGTFLEGSQSVWHIPRPLGEDAWQPTDLALLADGDVVVIHDGGYTLPVAPGETAGAEHFYNMPDRLSRLAPDLTARRWLVTYHTPAVDPAKVERFFLHRPWPHPHLGNVRSLRLRADARDRLYVAGWSPTQTAAEPWWSPFLFAYDGKGARRWSAYTYDPMSGPDNRLGTLVSDSAIVAVAPTPEGHLLFAGIGDGGNSVLRQDPRDYLTPAPALKGNVYGFRGRTLFWGLVGELDGATRALRGGRTICGWSGRHLAAAWPVDLAPLPAGGVVVAGRHTSGFAFSADAWHQSERPGGFITLYTPDFESHFCTSLPAARPLRLTGAGRRFALVGDHRAGMPRQSAPQAAHGGGTDALLAVFEIP